MKSRPKKILVVTRPFPWSLAMSRQLIDRYSSCDVRIVTKKERLTEAFVRRFNPDYIFFPHWSWLIPPGIYENYSCVVFHMTDLPFGRGGSPLQNLILRGIKKTKITALRAVKEMDSGPVYCKQPLSLAGSAAEIFQRAAEIIFGDMIPFIIKNNPGPVPQKGKVVRFKRRRPAESDLRKMTAISGVYDFIRMLDAEGYPKAFLTTAHLRLEFCDAQKKGKTVLARVRISERETS